MFTMHLLYCIVARYISQRCDHLSRWVGSDFRLDHHTQFIHTSRWHFALNGVVAYRGALHLAHKRHDISRETTYIVSSVRLFSDSWTTRVFNVRSDYLSSIVAIAPVLRAIISKWFPALGIVAVVALYGCEGRNHAQQESTRNKAPYNDADSITQLPAATSRDSGKLINDAPTEIQLGIYQYCIPRNYLTPYNDWQGQKVRDTVEFTTFLPDFGGFDRNNFWLVSHPDKIVATINAENRGTVEAEAALAQRLDNGEVARKPSLDQFGLTAYQEVKSAGGVVFMANGGHGQMLLIDCLPLASVPECQVRYHHKTSQYWLDYGFNYQHLSEWREIDNGVNQLLAKWRVAKPRDLSARDL